MKWTEPHHGGTCLALPDVDARVEITSPLPGATVGRSAQRMLTVHAWDVLIHFSLPPTAGSDRWETARDAGLQDLSREMEKRAAAVKHAIAGDR